MHADQAADVQRELLGGPTLLVAVGFSRQDAASLAGPGALWVDTDAAADALDCTIAPACIGLHLPSLGAQAQAALAPLMASARSLEKRVIACCNHVGDLHPSHRTNASGVLYSPRASAPVLRAPEMLYLDQSAGTYNVF